MLNCTGVSESTWKVGNKVKNMLGLDSQLKCIWHQDVIVTRKAQEILFLHRRL